MVQVKQAGLGEEDARRLRELKVILKRAGGRGLKDAQLEAFPRLYRHACTTLARVQTRADDPELELQLQRLVSEAHAVHHRPPRRSPAHVLAAMLHLFLAESPRTIRAEWRLLLVSFSLMYGLALVAWFAVSHDLDLAPSLLAPAMVEAEIQQLEAGSEGEAFRGNFTFGLGESPQTAGWIMVHNMGVGVLFFAAALLPPLYLLLLATNGLMLGTYTAVAGHWGQAGAISSILWCHGVIEIQAFVLAGTAGLALVRAWIRPGPWSRRHAMRRESQVAWRLLAPVFPLLFVAGLIEGFVSPHAPLQVRVATAVCTGLALVAWALLGGRGARAV
jgi:uncharacterized membrane protein SpoIIM required for sporulation